MNVLKLCVAIVSLFTIVSCSNEDFDNLSVADGIPKTKSIGNTVDLSSVAQLLTLAEIDKTVMDEVKLGVERSRKYGLDEEYRFTDMLKPSLSKMQRSSESSLLLQKMNAVLNKKQVKMKSEISSSDFFNYLSDNDIQIYWPFADNWNGHTLPIILSATDNNDWACKSVLTKEGVMETDTVKLTREFLKNNTVWLISINDTPYDELPDFDNGEYVNKDGVFFYSEIAKEWLNRENNTLRSSTRSGYSPGNAVYIGSINSLNYHDGGLAGGPEFDFIWCHIGMPFPPDQNPMPLVNRYRINVSTSEVGSAKQIDLCIQPNWTTSQITNALIVIEKDGGKDKKGHVSLSYNHWGKILSVDVSYKYERRDDFVFEQTFNRSDIFGDNNKTAEGTWKQYNGDQFWVNLPTK